MGRFSGSLGIAFVLVAGFGAVDLRADTPAVVVPVSGANTTAELHLELERETFALINQYRLESHLPVFVWNAEIARVARAHSQDMATGDVDFGHDGFGDRIHLLRKTLLGLRGAGENVLMTDDPREIARNAVNVWLKSPPHLHNIRGDFNTSGIGVSENNQGVIYLTQIFVKLQPTSGEESAASAPRVVSPFGLLAAPAATKP